MKNEVYRLFNSCDDLLYVGLSGQSLKRFSAHRGAHYWADDVVTIRIERFETQLGAQIAEIEAILTEKPRHNSVHPKAAKMLKTLKAKIDEFDGLAGNVSDLRSATGHSPGRKHMIRNNEARMEHIVTLVKAGAMWFDDKGFLVGLSAEQLRQELNAADKLANGKKAKPIKSVESVRRYLREPELYGDQVLELMPGDDDD